MAQVQPLSKELIEQAIRARPWRFMVDSDGDFRIEFATDTVLGDLNAFFSLVGTNKDALRCFGFFDLEIQSEHFSQAIFLCNEYHNKFSWPCIYLHLVEKDGKKVGRLWCQEAHTLEKGIHVEGLLELLRQFVGGSAGFSTWLVKQPQFWK